MTDKIQTLIDRYIETRLDYDEAHEASVRADKAHKAAKAQLVETMIELGRTGEKLDNGLSFNLRNQFSISCSEANEEHVLDWLEEHYGDAEEFIVPKPNKRAITEKLKTDIEGGKLDELDVPDFFALKTRPDVSCTGWKPYSEKHRRTQ